MAPIHTHLILIVRNCHKFVPSWIVMINICWHYDAFEMLRNDLRKHMQYWRYDMKSAKFGRLLTNLRNLDRPERYLRTVEKKPREKVISWTEIILDKYGVSLSSLVAIWRIWRFSVKFGEFGDMVKLGSFMVNIEDFQATSRFLATSADRMALSRSPANIVFLFYEE